MNYIVYQTTNLINGKIYVGMHIDRPAKQQYLGSGHLIKAAIKKHGRSNFKRETLATFTTAKEASNFEKSIVTPDFIKRKDVYNICEGGQGGMKRTKPFTEEQLLNIRENHWSRKKATEVAALISQARRGHTLSSEHKSALSRRHWSKNPEIAAAVKAKIIKTRYGK